MENDLHQAAKKTPKDVLSFLKQSEIFGDLIEHEQFTIKYGEIVQSIYEGKGIRTLMQEMI